MSRHKLARRASYCPPSFCGLLSFFVLSTAITLSAFTISFSYVHSTSVASYFASLLSNEVTNRAEIASKELMNRGNMVSSLLNSFLPSDILASGYPMESKHARETINTLAHIMQENPSLGVLGMDSLHGTLTLARIREKPVLLITDKDTPEHPRFYLLNTTTFSPGPLLGSTFISSKNVYVRSLLPSLSGPTMLPAKNFKLSVNNSVVDSNVLVFTTAYPHFTTEGVYDYCVFASTTIAPFSSLTENVYLTPRAIIIIFEETGSIISSNQQLISESERVTENSNEPMKMSDSSNPLIIGFLSHLREKYGDLKNLPSRIDSTYVTEGENVAFKLRRMEFQIPSYYRWYTNALSLSHTQTHACTHTHAHAHTHTHTHAACNGPAHSILFFCFSRYLAVSIPENDFLGEAKRSRSIMIVITACFSAIIAAIAVHKHTMLSSVPFPPCFLWCLAHSVMHAMPAV